MKQFNLILFFCFAIVNFCFAQKELNQYVLDPFNMIDDAIELKEKYTALNNNIKIKEFPIVIDSARTYKYIDYFINSKSKNTSILFSLISNDYLYIKSKLEEYKLPPSFALLPSLISGYNSSYVSKYGASGLWGLNYVAAAKNKLIMNKSIDQRKDDSLSTIAAINHLSYLYKKYDNESMTILAYVSSPSLVNRAIKRAGSKNLNEIIEYIDDDFISLLIAFNSLNIIEKNRDFYNIKPLNIKIKTPANYKTITLEKELYFEAISDKIIFNYNFYRENNLEIREDILPSFYPLKLDSISYNLLSNNLDSIYYYQDSVLFNVQEDNYIPSNKTPETYVVVSGDYLGKIAELYNVGVSDLQKWNDIPGTRIDIGQSLIVYQPKAAIDTSNYITYKVKKGDGLWLIAEKYPESSVKQIMDLNSINRKLKPGQILIIQEK